MQEGEEEEEEQGERESSQNPSLGCGLWSLFLPGQGQHKEAIVFEDEIWETSTSPT